jgi:hypothetical protein
MILTCESDGASVRRSGGLVCVERAPSPAALDFAFDVDLGTDHYTAHVSQRLSQSDEVRATAFMLTFFILAFAVEQDNYWFVPPPDLR